MKSKLVNFFLVFLLASIWGPSFLFIKIAGYDFPPITLVACRLLVGALFLSIILFSTGRRLPPFGRIWLHFLVMGLVAAAVPFTCFAFGELTVDSSLAAMINGSTPIFTVLIAHYTIKEEPITLSKVIGILLGCCGLLFLFIPTLTDNIEGNALGAASIVGGSLCYAIGFVYARKYMTKLPPFVAPTCQILVVAVLWAILAVIFDPISSIVPTQNGVLSILALGIFGTCAAFVIYYKLVEKGGASLTSMVTYLLPVFGGVLGVCFLDEQLHWYSYWGCALILLGMLTVNGIFERRRQMIMSQ